MCHINNNSTKNNNNKEKIFFERKKPTYEEGTRPLRFNSGIINASCGDA